MSLTTGSSAAVATALATVLLAAALAGLVLYLVRGRAPVPAKSGGKRRLPTQWPLNPRPLANTHERHVWQWLQTVFPEHHVMIKLPVTRFTMPRQPGEGSEWFNVLSGAYCSFTLCDQQGRVIGCVDVLGPRGLSRGNRQLKQTLLAQCGIGYWVLSAESLPHPQALRAEFLGSAAIDSRPPRHSQRAELETARHQLHEALGRNRSHRHHRSRETPADEAGHDAHAATWQQADSFLGSLDSRRAPLEPS